MTDLDLETALLQVRSRIRDVPDFPKEGILFRDITPVLADPAALQATIALHEAKIADLVDSCDAIVGIESRGFLFGMALAARLRKGFIPVRKPGKLPAATYEESYELEYGTDRLQIHVDGIRPGGGVIIVDDLLATGGTAAATCRLVQRAGGKVLACLFLVELTFLAGRARLDGHRVEAVVTY